MELKKIQVGQARLRNPGQLAEMVATIEEGGALPPILLAELEDGTLYIQDGHNRSVAYVLAGRASLNWGEYILLPVEHARALKGKLTDPQVLERLQGPAIR